MRETWDVTFRMQPGQEYDIKCHRDGSTYEGRVRYEGVVVFGCPVIHIVNGDLPIGQVDLLRVGTAKAIARAALAETPEADETIIDVITRFQALGFES